METTTLSHMSSRNSELNMTLSDLPCDLWRDMHDLIEALVSRIPSVPPARLPPAEIRPQLRLGYFSLAIQDHRRASELLACRLYYYESIPELPSNVEKEVRVTRSEMTDAELHLARRVGARLRKMAWAALPRPLWHVFS